MSARRRLGLLGAAALLAAGACRQSPRPAADPWLADVAAVNRQADRLLDADDAAGARALLETLVAAQKAGAPLDDDRRLALQDCYFRLARLALAAHQPDQALADADRGLSYQTAPGLFVANLLVARGAAHEALNEPRAAAEDYHRALMINDALLRRAVGEP